MYTVLRELHNDQSIFSYGISDNPDGIALFPLGKKTGVLVTGKPIGTVLPPPFNQVPSVGLGHQVHHKFVVCGFNGDNLLAVHDEDIATVFAIEGLALVDHFDFLDESTRGPKGKSKPKTPPSSKVNAAEQAEWFLSTDDSWAGKFFDSKDLHCVDRQLFA